MRIVREQMLCVITPDWPGDPAALESGSLHGQLRALLGDVDIVHFASLALLPPAPGNAGGLPSLLLEIVVDEGTTPAVLMNRLAHHPAGALWALYGCCHPGPQPATLGERNDWLRGLLLRQLDVADGGFVGPRDRYIAQIRQERVLAGAVREAALRIEPPERLERSSFAAALARRVLRDPQFEWAGEAAPRSFWRANGGGAKFALFGLLVALAGVALWLLAGVASALRVAWAWLAGWTTPALAKGGDDVLQCLSALARWGLDSMVRAGLVLLLALLVVAGYGLLFSLLGRLAARWHGWFAALGRELNRPSDAWSARVTHALAWLTVPAIALLVLAALAYVVAGPEPLRALVVWHADREGGWLHVAAMVYAAVYGALLAVLAIGLRNAEASVARPGDGWLLRRLKAARRRFFRPSEAPVARAQQAHPMIEQCEARLVAGTAHMVSLTDLRRPYAWSAFWTRASLWAVTSFGYFFFTEGKLGDAPGIQFSHWHVVDRGRRLLFCANFDGTFGGYLDDFIKGPSIGTTLFWRWTELKPRAAAVAGHPAVAQRRRFPPTRLLVFRGVRCEQQFKTYARESMLPHLFRFVAQDLTLEEKNRATGLRDALGGQRTDAKDDLVMRALES